MTDLRHESLVAPGLASFVKVLAYSAMDIYALTHVEKRARLIEKPVHAAAPRQFGGRRALDGERNCLELCVHTNGRVVLQGGRLTVWSLSLLSP